MVNEQQNPRDTSAIRLEQTDLLLKDNTHFMILLVLHYASCLIRPCYNSMHEQRPSDAAL